MINFFRFISFHFPSHTHTHKQKGMGIFSLKSVEEGVLRENESDPKQQNEQ